MGEDQIDLLDEPFEKNSIGRDSTSSFKLDDHDFRVCVHAHRGSPGARPAGGIDQKVFEPL